MTKKIIWRLKEPPTSENLIVLVRDGILSKDEAREMLFNFETDNVRDQEDLKSEIKFLRELVDKLCEGNSRKIVETVKWIEKPYVQTNWYQPYTMWCSTNGTLNITDGTISGTGFSGIKTF